MLRWAGRLIGGAGLLFVGVLAVQSCSSRPAAPSPPADDLKPIVSVKELMESIVDPIADNIFDAVAVDSTEKGIVEHRPTTDEDWAKVRQGAVTLAEASNLLKMHRPVAPSDDPSHKNDPKGPELPPAEIQKRIDGDRARWNQHVDGLRDEALKVLDIVKARDADGLFKAGSNLDAACENCHLEYWYPGDKKAVLEDKKKKVYYTTPAPARR
jgi:cytochrome c556